MRHFWSRRMLSVNGGKRARRSGANSPDALTVIAKILQNTPASVSRILTRLLDRGLLAKSPARQIAQIAIASRCGNGVDDGISFLEASSVPLVPLKLYGPAAASGGRLLASAPNRMLVQGYEGFKSPLPPLNALPEQHSFVDLFEQLLFCSREPGGESSILERQGAGLGSAIISRPCSAGYHRARRLRGNSQIRNGGRHRWDA